MSPESYRHYSVVSVHGRDICRVVLRLPGETPDGLAGQESTKVGHGGGEAEAGGRRGPGLSLAEAAVNQRHGGRGLTEGIIKAEPSS